LQLAHDEGVRTQEQAAAGQHQQLPRGALRVSVYARSGTTRSPTMEKAADGG